jgi:hypothetical protein
MKKINGLILGGMALLSGALSLLSFFVACSPSTAPDSVFPLVIIGVIALTIAGLSFGGLLTITDAATALRGE